MSSFRLAGAGPPTLIRSFWDKEIFGLGCISEGVILCGWDRKWPPGMWDTTHCYLLEKDYGCGISIYLVLGRTCLFCILEYEMKTPTSYHSHIIGCDVILCYHCVHDIGISDSYYFSVFLYVHA